LESLWNVENVKSAISNLNQRVLGRNTAVHYVGRKPMALRSGERQVWETIGRVRNDHTARYYWAKSKLNKGDAVLDAMCGIGYGSFIMATSLIPKIVVAFDCDEETIDYAKKYYADRRIEFWCHDYKDMQFEEKVFDKIVCFEGIEHIDEPRFLLSEFHKYLKDDGTLLLSTPNGRVLPRDPVKHPEHKFHYTPEEFGKDLDECGFQVVQWLSQHNKHSLKMNQDLEGKFMLATARKK
jgi:cyclopropane fatty-acyl-phospholipid synthase-like methyltransferase